MKFRRQHGIGSYIVDFYCPDRALVVEVDGDVHGTDNQAKRDQIRDHYLQSLGLKIVRYTNDEIFKNLDGVLDHLSQGISNISTSPSLRSSSEQSLTKEGHFQDISNPLPRSFYDRPTLTVAQDLLGKVLVCQSTHRVVEAKIVEVEAYVGPQDKACHASKGRTNRTEVMFGPAGFTYVYLIYGMYHCLNLVTEQIDYPAAVLIRGLEITDGETTSVRVEGPGRVCRFLNVDRTHNELDATKGEILWVEDRGFSIPPKHIQALPRIGVDYAGEWAKKPWRFCIPLRPNPGKRTGKR